MVAASGDPVLTGWTAENSAKQWKRRCRVEEVVQQRPPPSRAARLGTSRGRRAPDVGYTTQMRSAARCEELLEAQKPSASAHLASRDEVREVRRDLIVEKEPLLPERLADMFDQFGHTPSAGGNYAAHRLPLVRRAIQMHMRHAEAVPTLGRRSAKCSYLAELVAFKQQRDATAAVENRDATASCAKPYGPALSSTESERTGSIPDADFGSVTVGDIPLRMVHCAPDSSFLLSHGADALLKATGPNEWGASMPPAAWAKPRSRDSSYPSATSRGSTGSGRYCWPVAGEPRAPSLGSSARRSCWSGSEQ